MSTPILATKLYTPPLRPTAIRRPRLVERLNKGLYRKVTLISAPAGFGKSTLVSEWLTALQESGERQVAWLALDAGDSDPIRFLTYVVAALRTVAPQVGEDVLAALQSPQPPPIASILAALLNEIALLPAKTLLILDDYHVIDARPVDEALNFIVEHLPAPLHLVITTREDPRLPLARLRARDQLTEVRSADLRFSEAEIAGFFQAMGLALSAADVAALGSRTEGWIAGLQLAALSLQGQEDVTGFIRAFAGDHRYIVDYLVEEVLQRQPAVIRDFLLQTAILERLNGPLCEAVTEQQDGSARLEALERGNFFVTPLDNQRQWYRYHHLFADVLHAHLLAEQPTLVPMLHRRASAWYAANAMPADAIRHALAAQDFERAANLIEVIVPALWRSREASTLLGWLKALPAELLRNRPVLNVAYAWVLLSAGELEGVEAWLGAAERALAAEPERVVTAVGELRQLPGMIALYRAALAQAFGDIPNTMTYARHALELFGEEEQLGRGAAEAILGLALWTSGDLEAAYQTFAAGMARVQKAGNIADVIRSAIALAEMSIAQGRLHQAKRVYEQSMLLAAAHGVLGLGGMAEVLVGISELLFEAGDLAVATEQLQRSQELAERAGITEYRWRWCLVMARIRAAQADWAGALALLEEAERSYVRELLPNVRPLAAWKTRLWLAQGRLGDAQGWVREQGLAVTDDLTYLREFEHITLARVLLARYRRDQDERTLLDLIAFLARLLQAAQAGERWGSVIEILLLQALAHQEQGDTSAALMPLQRALTLAEPEGYLRIFAGEGAPVTPLLLEAAEEGIMPAYTGRLLAALGIEQPLGEDDAPLPAPPVRSAAQPLLEPLSQRELEVLRLFPTELSGPEIADQLVVALSTVRTHTKSIYSKLNVNSRRAAVKRAAELNLL